MRPRHTAIEEFEAAIDLLPVRERCLWCAWSWDGTAGEGRTEAIQHRLSAHPEVQPSVRNRRNVWGLASCLNSWPVPYFETWKEAISFYARFLSSRWPGHSTPYSFRGYAACSDCWARKVSYWMRSLFNVSPNTRYPEVKK